MLARRPGPRVLALLLAFAFGLAIPAGASTQTRVLCVHGVDGGRLKLRSGPTADSPVIDQIPNASCGLRLAGRCSGTHCQMALRSRFGWVDTRFVGVYEVPAAKHALATAAAPPQPAARPMPDARPSYRAPERRSLGGPERSSCVVEVAAGDTLRIRRGPGSHHDAIGGIPPSACGVERIGGCHGSWCMIAWRGHRGWVNSQYLN